jgi:ribosomal protein S27AE
MYRLIRNDEGRIRWLIEAEFDAGFEGDSATLDTLVERVHYYFIRISHQIKTKKVPCPNCGYDMTLAREYLDDEETGNWYDICDECGHTDFGEQELARLERQFRENGGLEL